MDVLQQQTVLLMKDDETLQIFTLEVSSGGGIVRIVRLVITYDLYYISTIEYFWLLLCALTNTSRLSSVAVLS